MHHRIWKLGLLYVLCWRRFVGFEIIKQVSPLLHTPLMSLTNAISAIVVVGAIIPAGEKSHDPDASAWDRGGDRGS